MGTEAIRAGEAYIELTGQENLSPELAVAEGKLRAFAATAVAIGNKVRSAIASAASQVVDALDNVNALYRAGSMQKQTDSTDYAAEAAAAMVRRLQELSGVQNLSNQQQAEAVDILGKLRERYGDLGVSIDDATGKLSGFSDAQSQIVMVDAKAAYDRAKSRNDLMRKNAFTYEPGGTGFSQYGRTPLTKDENDNLVRFDAKKLEAEEKLLLDKVKLLERAAQSQRDFNAALTDAEKQKALDDQVKAYAELAMNLQAMQQTWDRQDQDAETKAIEDTNAAYEKQAQALRQLIDMSPDVQTMLAYMQQREDLERKLADRIASIREQAQAQRWQQQQKEIEQEKKAAEEIARNAEKAAQDQLSASQRQLDQEMSLQQQLLSQQIDQARDAGNTAQADALANQLRELQAQAFQIQQGRALLDSGITGEAYDQMMDLINQVARGMGAAQEAVGQINVSSRGTFDPNAARGLGANGAVERISSLIQQLIQGDTRIEKAIKDNKDGAA